MLVHELERVHAAPRAVDVLNEHAAAEVCEACLTQCDVRAALVAVVRQLDLLQNSAALPAAQRQSIALQV
jgi:hypothetical protein